MTMVMYIIVSQAKYKNDSARYLIMKKLITPQSLTRLLILKDEIKNFILARFSSKCNFSHIPYRLKWDNKTTINRFSSKEKLFRRFPKSINDPFGTISLYDLSHNRSGFCSLSRESDVKINAEFEDAAPYEDAVLVMGVNLFLGNQPPKLEIKHPKDSNTVVIMELLHDPVTAP